MLTNIIQPSITAGFGIYELISGSTDVFRNEEVVIIFTNIELFFTNIFIKQKQRFDTLPCVCRGIY